VDILKKLTLSCRWVTTEENIDFTSESASSRLREFFAASTEKLAKNTLFNILILPNRWSKSIYEFFVVFRIISEILELLDLSLIEHLLMIVLKELILDGCIIFLV
jgi:hypothetical protein